MSEAQATNGETVRLRLREHVLDDVDAVVDAGHYADREAALCDAIHGFFGGYDL